MCQCYRRWQGADCSERVCQFDYAFVDSGNGDLNMDGVLGMTATTIGVGVPREQRGHEWWDFERVPQDEYGQSLTHAMGFSQNEGHAYAECSNKGLCDRKTGKCACFPGYTGSGCHRMECPGTEGEVSCSGHGTCEYVSDISTSYNLWDKKAARICTCDAGYQGADCAQRMCPRGDDPLHTNTTGSEVQGLYLACHSNNAGALGVEGSFRLVYTDAFGQAWTTTNITVPTGAHTTDTVHASTATAIQDALKAIPNDVLQSVVATAVSPAAKQFSFTFNFTGNPGDLHIMSSDTRGLLCNTIPFGYSSDADTVAHYKTHSGGYTNTECSNRGECDYESGLCGCFTGFTGDDCAAQDSLAV
jgi:hypothetical protein